MPRKMYALHIPPVKWTKGTRSSEIQGIACTSTVCLAWQGNKIQGNSSRAHTMQWHAARNNTLDISSRNTTCHAHHAPKKTYVLATHTPLGKITALHTHHAPRNKTVLHTAWCCLYSPKVYQIHGVNSLPPQTTEPQATWRRNPDGQRSLQAISLIALRSRAKFAWSATADVPGFGLIVRSKTVRGQSLVRWSEKPDPERKTLDHWGNPLIYSKEEWLLFSPCLSVSPTVFQ